MDQVRIGKFIAEERKRKGLTQLELAESLGVADKTIGNWEHARCMPDISMLRLICKELDVDIDELLKGKRKKKNIQKRKQIKDSYQLGKIIKKRRQELKISQYELAEKLSVTKVFIALIEHGRRYPTLQTMAMLCSVLEIEIDDLIYDKN